VKGIQRATEKVNGREAYYTKGGSIRYIGRSYKLEKRTARICNIVHELLHFSIPNHRKLWKSLMRAHLGDYELIENRLRKVASRSLAA